MNPILQTCLYDGNFYSVFIDTNQNISQQLKYFSQNLTEELKRLMDFFGITKLSEKFIIKIHSDIEEWKRFCQADSFYADYVVGMALNCTINVLLFDEYKKTESHKNDTFEDFEKVVIHEMVHICHQNLQPDFNKVIWFMGEGLATYLANQRYNQDEKIDFPKEVYFSGDENTFKQIHSPYCFAQKFVRFLVQKVPHQKLLEYACDADKLYDDWEIIWKE